MPESTAALCILFAGCFFLGATTRRHWLVPDGTRETVRRLVALAGWGLLMVSVVAFAQRFGWEVGIAWFLLWLTFGTLAATAWLSLRPRLALWVGTLFALVAVGAWAL